MRKSSLTLLSLLLFSLSSFGQWQTIATNTSVKEGIFFLNESEGIGVYGQGILRTTDGGFNWDNLSQQNGNTWGGDDLSFKGSNGFVVIDNTSGVATNDIYYTNDSGKTWQSAQHKFNQDVHRIEFVSPDTGFVITANSAAVAEVYATYDGASSWTTLYTGDSSMRFVEIAFANSQVGYIGGITGDTVPTIFRTFDGGLTWDSVIPAMAMIHPLNIEVVDENSVYLTSGLSGVLHHSIDSAKTWTSVYLDTSQWIKHVRFPHPDTGYFVAYDLNQQSDVIYNTVDAGSNWQQQTFDGWPISDMFFTDAHTGWVCGVQGQVGSLGIQTTSQTISAVIRMGLFPNPVNKIATVTLGEMPVTEFEVEILDANGRSIRSWNEMSSSFEIDFSNIPAGLYLLRVSSPTIGAETLRFLVD